MERASQTPAKKIFPEKTESVKNTQSNIIIDSRVRRVVEYNDPINIACSPPDGGSFMINLKKRMNVY